MKKIILIFLYLLISCTIIAGNLYITILNVGHGDSAIIRTPQNKIILIDCGNGLNRNPALNAGKNILLPFLKKLRIKTIDAVILTHPHDDHIGGFFSLLGKIKIKKVYDPGYAMTSYKYAALLKKISDYKIAYSIPVKGDTLKIDPEIKINVLNPPAKLFEFTKSDANNNSITLHISYNKFSILMTGDIENEAERYIVKNNSNIKCDVIKVPHHGSKTSTYRPFLKKLGAKYAIISVSKDNSFGLPNAKTLRLYLKYGMKILRTDVNGHIYIKSDGKGYSVETEK